MKVGGSTVMKNDWECEEDVRTLCRAEEIKRDPKRLAKAKKMAGDRKKELESITGVMPEKM